MMIKERKKDKSNPDNLQFLMEFIRSDPQGTTPQWLRRVTCAHCTKTIERYVHYKEMPWKEKIMAHWRSPFTAFGLGVLYYGGFVWIFWFWLFSEKVQQFTPVTLFILMFILQNIIMIVISPLLIQFLKKQRGLQ